MRSNRAIGIRAALFGLTVLVAAALAGCDPAGGSAAPGTGTAPSSPAASPSPPQKEGTGGGSGSGDRGAVEPCALVTKAEAERLAGTALQDPTPVGDTCTYTAPPSGPTRQVEVFTGRSGKAYFDAERILRKPEPLPGIGDEAFIADHEVFLNKSGFWVSIHLVSLDDPAKTRQPLEDLARKVADRI